MQMDVLNFNSDDTSIRYTLNSNECMLLMDACAALREARFPGILRKLPRQFDEHDVANAVGSADGAEELMNIFELEQAFHIALHQFPGGHHHGDDEDERDDDHEEETDVRESSRLDPDDAARRDSAE